MLKFILKQDNKEFVIHFDVPVVPAISNQDEFGVLAEAIGSKDKCSLVTNGNDEISGASGAVSAFLDIIDDVLPPKEAAVQRGILDKLMSRTPEPARDGLQVNFHQKPFDSSIRYWEFILNQGNFINYFFNRIDWYIAPKNRIVSPFPLHVDIESASTCNMSCPMCYRDMMKETGQMDFDLFKKAVDECAENNVYSIRLSWRGETLTHPRIKEMIAYATQNIRNVSFLTNAFYLNEDMINCFIENRVSYVAVSFDGIDDVYEYIRHPAKFSENYERLDALSDKKAQAGSKLPQVRLCTIWPAIKKDPDAYYQTMKPVSDYIVCNPYINFKGPMKIKPDFICQYPWERIVIGFDGKTQCCTGWNADDIILGNVSETSIYEMWHSDLMNDIRKVHATGQRMRLNSCANCRHGSEGDPDINISDIIKRRY